MIDSKDLLYRYTEWLRQKYHINNLENADEIITPFTNNINDRIRLYIEKLSNGNLRLSDDGNTLNELEMNGLDLNSETRKKIFNTILINFKVEMDGDVLFVIADEKNFPVKKHNLMQAILRINDMLMLKRNTIVQLFNEEVSDFLYEKEVIGTPELKLVGASGLEYQIDYTIGRTKTRPEIIVQFVNTPSFSNITTQSFIYDDISQKRRTKDKDIKLSLIVNDLENKVSKKGIAAAESKNIDILRWSNKDEILAGLK